MSDTISALVPIVTFLASAVGAGIAASWLFTRLRCTFPAPVVRPANAFVAFAYDTLYNVRYARWTAFALSALVSVAFSAALAALTGQDMFRAVDVAFAGWVNQLWHGRELPNAARYDYEVD